MRREGERWEMRDVYTCKVKKYMGNIKMCSYKQNHHLMKK